jgi:hypothetical protein
VSAQRWRACAAALKELERVLQRLHVRAHAYRHLQVPSPQAEAFRKEWPAWWGTLGKAIVIWHSDPHGALTVMRLKGLLPCDCAFSINLPAEQVQFLRGLYGNKAPDCLERTPAGKPCRACETNRDLLHGLLLQYWTCAVFLAASPQYPDLHAAVLGLVRRGRLLFEEAEGNRKVSRQLADLIAGNPPVPAQPRRAAQDGPHARGAAGGASAPQTVPSEQALAKLGERLREQLGRIDGKMDVIVAHVEPKRPVIAKGADGEFYFAGRKIELTDTPKEMLTQAYGAEGRWVEIRDTVFSESERQITKEIRDALHEAGDPKPKFTFLIRKSKGDKNFCAYRINHERLGVAGDS